VEHTLAPVLSAMQIPPGQLDPFEQALAMVLPPEPVDPPPAPPAEGRVMITDPPEPPAPGATLPLLPPLAPTVPGVLPQAQTKKPDPTNVANIR